MKILSSITRLFKSARTTKVLADASEVSAKQAIKTTQTFVSKPAVTVSKAETSLAQEENPFLEYIYEMYAKDGVSRDVVRRIVIEGERQRFYRYVGKEELDKLLAGKRITSSRPCHGGNLTDVTSNPNYGKIPTIGKYRLSFKDKPEFSPYPLSLERNSRIIEHDLKDAEYYLRGGYDISDIEKIEQYMGGNSFRLLDFWG